MAPMLSLPTASASTSRPQHACRLSEQQPQLQSLRQAHTQQQSARRRQLLCSVATLVTLGSQRRACAEGFKLPGSKNAESARSKLEAAEKGFAESEILKTLREKTGLNKAKNKAEIVNKYCYRQAEIGVGDCAGLRLIPGATKSGTQKPPEWLTKIPFIGSKAGGGKDAPTGRAKLASSDENY